jgi:non-ribosomal peptide synthetase component F
MARGHELLIAQIAIAKTGAAWLPFDADAPVERIASVSDARPRRCSPASAFRGQGAVAAPILVDEA